MALLIVPAGIGPAFAVATLTAVALQALVADRPSAGRWALARNLIALVSTQPLGADRRLRGHTRGGDRTSLLAGQDMTATAFLKPCRQPAAQND